MVVFVITYEGKYWTFDRTLSDDLSQARVYNHRIHAESARLHLLRGRPNFKAELMEVKEILKR